MKKKGVHLPKRKLFDWLKRPKKVTRRRRNAPAFKKRKVVMSKRMKHPYAMYKKSGNQIIGYELTSKKRKESQTVSLKDSRSKKGGPSYAYTKKSREKSGSLWIPDDYRGWKISKRDMRRIKRAERQRKRRSGRQFFS